MGVGLEGGSALRSSMQMDMMDRVLAQGQSGRPASPYKHPGRPQLVPPERPPRHRQLVQQAVQGIELVRGVGRRVAAAQHLQAERSMHRANHIQNWNTVVAGHLDPGQSGEQEGHTPCTHCLDGTTQSSATAQDLGQLVPLTQQPPALASCGSAGSAGPKSVSSPRRLWFMRLSAPLQPTAWCGSSGGSRMRAGRSTQEGRSCTGRVPWQCQRCSRRLPRQPAPCTLHPPVPSRPTLHREAGKDAAHQREAEPRVPGLVVDVGRASGHVPAAQNSARGAAPRRWQGGLQRCSAGKCARPAFMCPYQPPSTEGPSHASST